MRVGSAILVAALVAAALPGAYAQPAGPTAKQLYTAAEQAMSEGRYAEAAADYAKAYELSKEPTLFFKLGGAYQKAGDCQRALPFYVRYLREAKPDEKYVTLTRQRIVECGGDPDKLLAAADPPPEPVKPPAPVVEEPKPPVAPPVVVETAAPPPPPTPKPVPPPKHQGAWLLVGGSIALVTIGGVLAYSADAAENDVTDLYVGIDGNPPRFDDKTRARYDELVDEGNRYQTLSLVSFGLAGALAVGATVLFLRDRDEAPPRVAPIVSPRNTGIVVRF